MNRRSHCAFWVILLLVTLSGIFSVPALFAADEAVPAPLGFTDRVACVERVEDAYWSHRTWPEHNPAPKPSREEVVSRKQVAAMVEETLLFEAALENVWGESLSPGQIQTELDRIARSTKHPDLLRDVFAALNHDPYLVAECFVRPRLAERTARDRFVQDAKIHRAVRERAEAALLGAQSIEDLKDLGAQVSEQMWRVEDRSDSGDRDRFLNEGGLILAPPEWRGMTDRLIRAFEGSPGLTDGLDESDPDSKLHQLEGRGFSTLFEEDDAFIAVSVLETDHGSVRIVSAVWPKMSFGDWMEGKKQELRHTAPGRATYILPAIETKSQCIDNTWEPTSTVGAPASHSFNATIWTGAEMIVWGGGNWPGINTGGRYDLAADSWTATSTSGAPSARQNTAGAWTGTEMIVWGGIYYPTFLNTGGRYNPATNSWTSTSTTGAPTARSHQSGVWTGTEMIVWGGNDSSTHLATGGRYNPASNTWTATSTTNAPSARRYHTAVWTGTEMIIWGGNNGAPKYNTGARYSPAIDSWTSTSLTDVPEARSDHTAVWTGTEMIVWGGDGVTSGWVDTGGRYDPTANGWTPTSNTAAPEERIAHSTVWTGTEMIIWGGGPNGTTVINSGGRYDPAGDVWTATTTTDAPSPRGYHSSVWPGATPKMIVWSGWGASGPLDTGGLYCVSGIVPYDFGDAQDPAYPTLLASDGARHRLGSALYLGSDVDPDDDGQPTAGADGDDTDPEGDDEDGVTFTDLLTPGGVANLEVVASAAGLLNAWIDFNSDGDWSDAGEQIFTDEVLAAGTNPLVVSVPLDAVVGTTYARFRLDSTGGLSFTGAASDGEVEDHQLTIVALDYGDAPDPTYPTLFASDGARHLLGGVLYLGSSVDADADGQPTSGADGDDGDGSDDEDGVVFTSVSLTGYTANIEVTSSASGLLNAWVDFNADGDWADAGEQVFTDEALVAGVNALGIAIPASATIGDTFSRFRFDTVGGLTPDGPANDGEVEDYLLDIRSSTLNIPKTGQTASYAAGDDGTFQAGVQWPDPRFTDHGDGTMTDELTGLMWTQDNVTPGPPACTPGVRKNWYDSLTHVDCLNANIYLGHSDWRMPNAIEIMSLANHGEVDQRTWLASQGFTLTPWYYWWSSTTPAQALAATWVLAHDGGDGTLAKTNSTSATLWPVRGTSAGSIAPLAKTGQIRCWNSSFSEIPCAGTGQDGEHQAGIPWPSPRFEVAGDCVTDRLTGLMWTKNGNLFGGRTWGNAVDDALGLTLCGYDDWRLPSRLEVRTLVHFDRRPGNTPPTLIEWWESQGFVNTTQYQPWSGTSELISPYTSAYKMQGGSSKSSDIWVVWPVRQNLLHDDADLSIVATDSTDPVAPGGSVTYNLDVDNLGPNTAAEVTVIGILPTGSSFVSASGAGWSCGEDSGVVTCTITDLGMGAAAPIALEINAPSAPDTISTTFIVDSTQSDPIGENNAATETTVVAELDYGDAPDPTYPTLLASDGARHMIDGTTFLGATVDAEPDGQPTANATGDDNDAQGNDEDGVVFTSGIGAGLDASLDVTASGAGLLNAWIDFNDDGDWADADEQIFIDQALVAGVNQLSFPVPSDATLESTFARFRLDSSGGLSFVGLAADGEVEDYMVEIVEGPDLEIAMAASSEPTASGRPLTYNISVTNNGPLTATSVTVTDTLPEELIFVSSTPGAPDCTFASGTLTCDLGAMAPTDTAQITIVTMLDHPLWGSFSNSASITATETDPIQANNTVTVDTNIALFVDGFESGDLSGWDSAFSRIERMRHSLHYVD